MAIRKNNKLAILVSLFLASLIFITSCGKSNETKEEAVTRPVKTMVIGKQTVGVDRSFPGKVKAGQEVQLAFEVQGKLMELPIQEGMDVDKGQLLARLDPKRFIHEVETAKAKYNLAKAELGRYATLIKKGYTTRAAYDLKKANYEVAEVNVRDAERRLNDSYIYAPFKGVVSKKFVENFQHIRAKQVILDLQNISNVDIVVDIPEFIVANTKNGKTINYNVNFESVPDKTFPVKLKKYEAEADPETQTYKVIFNMPAPENYNILPGMTVTLHVAFKSMGSKKAQGFEVPSSAVFADEKDNSYLWIVNQKNMTVTKRKVKLGPMKGDNVLITEGLKPNERIVTAGVHFLREGEKVRLMPDKFGIKFQ